MAAEIHTKTNWGFSHLNANAKITKKTYCLLTCEGMIFITNKGEKLQIIKLGYLTFAKHCNSIVPFKRVSNLNHDVHICFMSFRAYFV